MTSQSRLESPYHKEALEWIPASPFTSFLRDTVRGDLSRRDLLIRSAALGVTATALGQLLAREAAATPAGPGRASGRRHPARGLRPRLFQARSGSDQLVRPGVPRALRLAADRRAGRNPSAEPGRVVGGFGRRQDRHVRPQGRRTVPLRAAAHRGGGEGGLRSDHGPGERLAARDHSSRPWNRSRRPTSGRSCSTWRTRTTKCSTW